MIGLLEIGAIRATFAPRTAQIDALNLIAAFLRFVAPPPRDVRLNDQTLDGAADRHSRGVTPVPSADAALTPVAMWSYLNQRPSYYSGVSFIASSRSIIETASAARVTNRERGVECFLGTVIAPKRGSRA